MKAAPSGAEPSWLISIVVNALRGTNARFTGLRGPAELKFTGEGSC